MTIQLLSNHVLKILCLLLWYDMPPRLCTVCTSISGVSILFTHNLATHAVVLIMRLYWMVWRLIKDGCPLDYFSFSVVSLFFLHIFFHLNFSISMFSSKVKGLLAFLLWKKHYINLGRTNILMVLSHAH